MINIEDVSYDHVQLTMVGRIERPKSVTMEEWRWFWESARQGTDSDLRSQISELEEEVECLRNRLDRDDY